MGFRNDNFLGRDMPRRGRGGSFRQSSGTGSRRIDSYGPVQGKSSFGSQQSQSNEETDRKSHGDEKEALKDSPKNQEVANANDDKSKQKQVLSASNSGRN